MAGKILNNIMNIILCVLLPYLLISESFTKFGTLIGFGVTILCFVALFLVYKPKIFTILGRYKYFRDHDQGFKYLEKAYATGRMNPQDELIYAYMLLRDGQLIKSEKLIAGTLHQKKHKLTEKNLLAAQLNKAIILWKKNDLDGAIKEMESVYNTGYRSTVHYQTLGIFYILNNELDKAESFIKEALEYNSDDASINDNLGLLYIKQGKWDEALEIYEKMFEDGAPTFIEAHYNYATVLEHMNNWEEACRYYQKALGCPEMFLSTVKRTLVESALTRAEQHLE